MPQWGHGFHSVSEQKFIFLDTNLLGEGVSTYIADYYMCVPKNNSRETY